MGTRVDPFVYLASQKHLSLAVGTGTRVDLFLSCIDQGHLSTWPIFSVVVT